MFREGADRTAFTSPVKRQENVLKNFDYSCEQEANHKDKVQSRNDGNGKIVQILSPNKNDEEHTLQNGIA